jgi:hypothetical protein
MSYSPKYTGRKTDAIALNVGEDIGNTSGLTLLRATPVRIDGNGNLNTIDVSVEAQALAVAGVTLENILDGTKGPLASSGRVLNIVTTANNGDVLYVSKTGGLTNIKPDIGVGGFVAGDFVIRMGVLFKNEDVITQQDLLLNIEVIGQL